MKWLLRRLSEPSTWAGFAAVVPGVLDMVAHGLTPAGLGAVVSGVAAVLMRERGAANA